MSDRYAQAILRFLADRQGRPLTEGQLARLLGVGAEQYGSFRAAVKLLRETGRVLSGAHDTLLLPALPKRVVGHFTQNPRGFGFVTPEVANAHGDLYIPAGQTGGALTGDRVVARVVATGSSYGKKTYSGSIVHILKRARNRFVGTLTESEGTWFVLPEGTYYLPPIVVRDISSASPPAGTKVVVEILHYGGGGALPCGVVVESLGKSGAPEAEQAAVIRSYGLRDAFPAKVLAEARRAARSFTEEACASSGRLDLSGLPTVTIDPPDARDWDDAVSLSRTPKGHRALGVHIADVSYFVPEGSALCGEARRRGTSVYFPRKVLPMLPEILSNGVCSLREGRKRFALSVFLTYREDGRVLRTRIAETIVCSDKRLSYEEAQALIDGRTGGDPTVVSLLRELCDLAKCIERRRLEEGMLRLDLPETELVLEDDGRVRQVRPADDSYTHTMIEMFMVEANEAVARTLARTGRPFLRRIHPPPDPFAGKQLAAFAGACGVMLSNPRDRNELMRVLASVRGKPESFAVNMAVLRTFQQAEYSPDHTGHFALASRCYTHFTSPIRRYPDLTVHRLVKAHLRGELESLPPADLQALKKLGEEMTAAEKTAEAAERELREVLLLGYLSDKAGESFRGIITGVADFGIFVQIPQLLIDGVVRMEELGDDWWEVHAQYGIVRGARTGRTFRVGSPLNITISGVDIARRQLYLSLSERNRSTKAARSTRRKKKTKRKKPPRGTYRRRRR